MLDAWMTSLTAFMNRGGPVMWVLLGFSVLAVTLLVERAWFWAREHGPGARRRLERMTGRLRAGDRAGALALAEADRGIYGRMIERLLTARIATEAAAGEAVESQRPRIDRFMTMLSTIITAAPLLGILGTVLGIIASFRVLSDATAVTDPRAVSGGIAEALLSTAAGLFVALAVLFPYNAMRVQSERAMGRFEGLIAAAEALREDGGQGEAG